MSEYPWFDFDQVDYVTSDTHFSHARISELAGRPFGTVEEMDAELIARWNATIGPDDVVLHLGDLALGPIEQSLALTARLNGRRFLVPGNHDRVSPATQSKRAIERFRPLYEATGWTILPEVIEGTRRGYRLLASHYPYAGDSQDADRHTAHRPRWDDGMPLLHGHTHARDHGPNGHQFHVGVDAHDYAPIPFTVIDEWIRTIPGIQTRLETAISEARQVIAGYDNEERPGMGAIFYEQGYNEFRIVLGELLDALDTSTGGAEPA
ncbi:MULTISPECIES: metallophosphoesterase [unclassified Microbacterium]|uniref:metallophosphoesterase n=1 Tax=unclassified Microbacterium TaxID=2609290 RepID=UPI002305686C|nr:metallophosphoesterase [Microbacterium sp. nov. GSS16]WCD93061.1 metallophosphoesterase family protein [Microbacterium sp. nov. GSS16]